MRKRKSEVPKYSSYALVTGAAGGMGRIYAETLAKRGYNLLLVDINRDGLAETQCIFPCRMDAVAGNRHVWEYQTFRQGIFEDAESGMCRHGGQCDSGIVRSCRYSALQSEAFAEETRKEAFRDDCARKGGRKGIEGYIQTPEDTHAGIHKLYIQVFHSHHSGFRPCVCLVAGTSYLGSECEKISIFVSCKRIFYGKYQMSYNRRRSCGLYCCHICGQG